MQPLPCATTTGDGDDRPGARRAASPHGALPSKARPAPPPHPATGGGYGKQFDPNRVTFSPKIGTTEEWTIHNVTKEEHPFHIHVNDFQVMSINRKKVDPKSLRDTQPLPVGGTVAIRMRFTQFLGRYVFHCHILAHEDGGMTPVVDVTKDGKPSPAPTTDVTGSMPGMQQRPRPEPRGVRCPT